MYLHTVCCICVLSIVCCMYILRMYPLCIIYYNIYATNVVVLYIYTCIPRCLQYFISLLAIDLVHRMLAFHPDDRITVEEALDHPYLQDFSGQLPEPTCDVFNFEYEHIELAVGNPAGVTSVEEEKKSKNIRMKLEVQEAIYQEVCRYRPPILKLPGEDMKCGGGRGEGAEDSTLLHVVTPSFGSSQSLKKPQQEECRDASQPSGCPPPSNADRSYHTARSAPAPTSSYPPPPTSSSTVDAYHPGCESNTFYTTRTHPHQPVQMPSSSAYNVYGNDDPGKASVSSLSTDGMPLVRGHARVSVDGAEGCGKAEGCSGGGGGCITGGGAYDEPSIFSFPTNKYKHQGSYRDEELKEFYSDPYRDNIHNSNNSYNSNYSNSSNSSSNNNIDRHDLWRPQPSQPQQYCQQEPQVLQQPQVQQQPWCQQEQQGQTVTVDVNFNPYEHSSSNNYKTNYKKHVRKTFSSSPSPSPFFSLLFSISF